MSDGSAEEVERLRGLLANVERRQADVRREVKALNIENRRLREEQPDRVRMEKRLAHLKSSLARCEHKCAELVAKRAMARPVRPGAYVWTDRDDDVEAALEPRGDHPVIVAALSLVRDNGHSAGIYIDYVQAAEIIAWLQEALAERSDPLTTTQANTSSA
jgi:hypothetical protein